MNKDKIINQVFYITIGLVSALALLLVFYSILRLDASLADVLKNSTPLYLAGYLGLTFGTVVLFGINISLFTYRIRKYGFPKLTGQLGAGFGSALGILASACPVCGSTLLSALGIASGLSAFPLGGLELKAGSFVLMALPVFLMVREMRAFDCGTKICPKPRDASFKEDDLPWLVILISIIIGLSFISSNLLQTDPEVAAKCVMPLAVQAK
jgi:hypothetical protein